MNDMTMTVAKAGESANRARRQTILIIEDGEVQGALVNALTHAHAKHIEILFAASPGGTTLLRGAEGPWQSFIQSL
jgi:hypothetical protein